MKQILHILKRNDPAALHIIRQQAKEAAVEVVLIQDAVSIVPVGIAVFVLADDAIGKTDCPTLSYQGLIEKIFRADTVVTW